ncbi:DUF445 domain-containing protein [Alkaliphilus hydrothermalis]|uniref:Uncharacterized membrane protein YheB (UPF0754 family) n=1 Tax=Alkaliphilus hydrothermalis TaxID=1482730 RepID=A0ABS2NSJ3_9FIRM|nr:DUF445 family protein [Alkaliphilus hydrothermalis]MBM7615922.1 uncharacterized membrane protein YheB (UPF0754 family) [Alkaliphilus hydrothermalis]
METTLLLLFLTLIGGLIGWITNLIAIKLMFRPFEPVKLPIVPVEIQGLIPKRKQEIAKSIGKTIQEELLSIDEIIEKFIEQQDQKELVNTIKQKIDKVINDRLPAILPSSIKIMIKSYISEVIDQEASKMINSTMEDLVHKAAAKIDLAEMVETRINEFPMEKLEDVVLKIAKEELKHIEILGGLLGIFIGLLQGIIIILL